MTNKMGMFSYRVLLIAWDIMDTYILRNTTEKDWKGITGRSSVLDLRGRKKLWHLCSLRYIFDITWDIARYIKMLHLSYKILRDMQSVFTTTTKNLAKIGSCKNQYLNAIYYIRYSLTVIKWLYFKNERLYQYFSVQYIFLTHCNIIVQAYSGTNEDPKTLPRRLWTKTIDL